MRLVRNHFLAKLVVVLENDLHIHQLELNVVFMLVPKSAPRLAQSTQYAV